MNSKIKIVDNFLEEKDFQKIFSNNLTWELQITQVLQQQQQSQHQSFTGKYVKELSFLQSKKDNDEFFNTYLFDKVVEKLDRGYYKLDKVYFNGQWNGREGEIHEDGCDVTALIYISPYEYGWGGFTEIMTEPQPTLIHPIPNRLVIFPGNIYHKAYSFVYQTCPLRRTLAFKIKQK